ncbi:MAG: haloacid dehalogenase, partial [Hungatella sp.]
MDVYQSEFVEFEKNFKNFKKSKIVLYGIGRMTATLLPMLQEYRIMGLMDRDETNIGKCYYNQLVLSEEEVEKQADLVI